MGFVIRLTQLTEENRNKAASELGMLLGPLLCSLKGLMGKPGLYVPLWWKEKQQRVKKTNP